MPRPFLFPGPVGALEALHHEAEGVDAPRAVAVVCHPHPHPERLDPATTHQGGNMHSTVAFKVARGLSGAGVACLRFNFRGVGESEGEHDGHGAEEEDAAAALDWLRARYPGAPTWAAGFSFGSRTVFGLARREPRIERLVLVGFPLATYRLDGVDRLALPTLIVWGSEDEYGTDRDLRASYPPVPDHVTVRRIEGADHFFRRHTKELEGFVRDWALEQLGVPPREEPTR